MRPGVSADCLFDGAELIAASEGSLGCEVTSFIKPECQAIVCPRRLPLPPLAPGSSGETVVLTLRWCCPRIPAHSVGIGSPQCEKFPLAAVRLPFLAGDK